MPGMNTHRFPILRISLILVSAWLTASVQADDLVVAKRPNQVFGRTVPAMIHAVAKVNQTAEAAITAAYRRVDDVNRLMSGYVPSSDVSRLNRSKVGQHVKIAPETLTCLTQALEVAANTEGAFDPTCRPLVTLWKDAARKHDRLPDQIAISTARASVDWRAVDVRSAEWRVGFKKDNMQLDLGGVAKGYALDLAIQALRKEGAVGGLVDLGGDLLAFGTNRGQAWRVGVQDPFDSQKLLMTLRVEDRAVATSGNYRQPLVIAGKTYSHIVDPRTGKPTAEAPSVTVIAKDGLTADAWATALSVLSVEEGRKLVDQRDDLEVLWITGGPDNSSMIQSRGFEQFVVKTAD
jgi:thiamine biosynthesis lipoprotein